MQVTIDGEPWSVDTTDLANLAELVARAEDQESIHGPSVVVSILVDGQPVPVDEMSSLELRRLEGMESIDIRRRSSLAVARSVLLQGADYTIEISRAIQQVVEHYQRNRNDLGNELLANVTDSMNVLIGITMSVAGVMVEQAERLGRLQGELVPWLEEMIEAQTAADPVRIADILDYEIRPRIESWGETMRTLAASDGGEEEPSISS